MRTELSEPKTILFPVDFSPHSKVATQFLSLLAQRFDSRVVVTHVLQPIDHPFQLFSAGMMETRSRAELARDNAAAWIQENLPQLRSEIRVEEGDPAAVIVRIAEELEADLICMPARGHGPFRRFLLGSTVAKVLNDAAVPVLTGVHMDAPATQTLEMRNIVCAFSPDERGQRALRAALLISRKFGARLTAAHALETQSREEVERAIKGVADAQVEIVIDSGDPAQVVSRVAHGADLVVIGRTAPGPLGRLRAQSYNIVRESPRPVLSV